MSGCEHYTSASTATTGSPERQHRRVAACTDHAAMDSLQPAADARAEPAAVADPRPSQSRRSRSASRSATVAADDKMPSNDSHQVCTSTRPHTRFVPTTRPTHKFRAVPRGPGKYGGSTQTCSVQCLEGMLQRP